jgi:hypothetical protein
MRLMKIPSLTVVSAALCIAACAPNTKYTWNNYDESLYRYYKNASNRAEYETALTEIVHRATREQPVPPGIYAELGYIRLENNDPVEAVRYFELERNTWPESATFMTRMIDSVKNKGAALTATPGSNEPIS